MFVQESFSVVAREPLPVTGSELLTFRPVDQESGGIAFILKASNRTAGKIDFAAVGSDDGVAGSFYPLGTDLTTFLDTNDTAYIVLNGPMPPYLGLLFAPAAGPAFDGRIAVTVRSAGQINQVLPPVGL